MNYLDRLAFELKNQKLAIYFYGAGFVADKLCQYFKKYNLEPDGYIVDEQYITATKSTSLKNGKPIIVANQLQTDCVLVDAIKLSENKPTIIPKNHHIKKVYQFDFASAVIHGVYNEDFLENNFKQIMALYTKLADNESRKALMYFVSQKVSGIYSKPITQKTPYFDDDFLYPTENEVFVDCGAYNGDTLLSFLDWLKRYNIPNYSKCFAFEPDKKNFELLTKNFGNYSNVELHCIGTHSCKTTLAFADGNDTGSKISTQGTTKIDVDTIDNITQGTKVTYIKMDIEGAELETLKGAKNTILKYFPKLAVCVYHKEDDLVTIPNYILNLNQNYRLYFRNYYHSGTEAVLYAI